MKSKTWPNMIHLYIQHLKAAGRASGTIRVHSYYLSVMREIAPVPTHVTRERLEAWLAEHDWKPETRRSAQGVASQFFKYMEDEGFIKSSPARALTPVIVPDGIPHPASESQVAIALREGDSRTRLMVRLAAFCGLRACEICKVRGDDWNGEVLKVIGKGGRERIIPVQDGALIQAFHACPSFLFPGRIEGHLSPAYTAKLLGKVLPDGVTGHALRHRFGTVAYRATHDLLSVGAVMGHVKTDTTKRYIKLDLDPLVAAVSAAQF
ncbi:tyrosine-type recombinase/integrase [Mobiluncus holmesii]|uniref:Tyrosine-type recombinase/integrase n=2 Tax=Mobiluncus porci TaxID=2652278 RepID=A0A7K0K1Z0_9ACTO|nr:tyrosine-type recombinase/integrase [Mobiluncus porci]